MQDCLQKDSICKASRLTQFLSLSPVIAALLTTIIWMKMDRFSCEMIFDLPDMFVSPPFVSHPNICLISETEFTEGARWIRGNILILSAQRLFLLFSLQWGVTSVGQCTATCVLHYSIFHHWQQNILILYDKKIGWSLAATNIFFIFHFYILNRCPRIKQNPRL